MKKFGEGQQPFYAIVDIPEGDAQELTRVTDQALNSLYGELFNLLQAHGINPTTTTSADLKQVARAVWAAANNATLFIDSGDANNKKLTHVKGGKFLYKLTNANDDGFAVEFINNVTNTSSVTISVLDVENNNYKFNNVPLLMNGEQIKAGKLTKGSYVKAYYDQSSNSFKMVSSGNVADLSSEDETLGDNLVTVIQKGGVKRTQHDKNAETLTPFDFGAIGDGYHHPLSERFTTLDKAKIVYPHATSLEDSIDWAAIQKCFDVARGDDTNGRKYDLNVSGVFSINKPLKYITAKSGNYVAMRVIRGDTLLNINFEGEYALRLHGRGIAWSGDLTIPCDRKLNYGVVVSSAGQDGGANSLNFGIKLDRCFIDGAKIWAVYFQENSMFSYLEFIRSGYSGVNVNDEGVGIQISATPSNFVLSPDPIWSYSVITVDTLPDIELSQGVIHVNYDGYVSRIYEMDRAAKTITVVPLIPPSKDTTKKLNYIYGGCVGMTGANSAGIVINQMSAFGCGHALYTDAMYPAQINYLCSEFSGIAINVQGLVSGPNINTAYFEGDKWQIIQRKQAASRYGSLNIAHSTGLELSRVQNISWGRYTDGSTAPKFSGLISASLTINNVKHQLAKGKQPNSVLPVGSGEDYWIIFNEPQQNKVYKANSTTIGFAPIDPNANRLFAYDTQMVTYVGTGANQAPTGTITFIPPSEDYTVNGGASASFSGFASVAVFVAFLNVTTKDIQVSCVSLFSNDTSAIKTIPATVTNLSNMPNGRYYFSPDTSISGLPTPTVGGAQQHGNVNTYFSYGTPPAWHRKTQQVEYPDLFEKWERLYSSSSGNYGAWKLISYEAKKGTTAQRPSNPQLGMKYYDTTLSTNGKPIEWNGSNWIDMTGAVV